MSTGSSRRGEIWEDITSSVDEADVPEVRKTLGNVLNGLSKAEDVFAWHLFQLGDDAWRTTERIDLDLPGIPQHPCTSAAGTGDTKFFRRPADEKLGLERCRQNAAKESASVESMRRANLEQFIDKWQRLPRKPARCTALHDALERIASAPTSTRAIVVTDGVETCLHSLQPIKEPQGDIRIVVLLITPTNAAVGGGTSIRKSFEDRSEVVQRAVPWAKVVPLFQFDESIFKSH